MKKLKRKYLKEEIKRRGDELYERVIRSEVGDRNPDHYVAIDVESGAYELDEDMLEAAERLRGRNPDAQVWLRRIGSRPAMRIGGARDQRSR